MKLQGIGASAGIAIAKVLVLEDPKIDIPDAKVQDPGQAVNLVQGAIKQAIREIAAIKAQAAKKLTDRDAAIFDAHISLASDPEMFKRIRQKITEDKMNAVAATHEAIGFFANVFATMEDAYMQERAADVRDMGTRVLNILSGRQTQDLARLNEEVIIVADDLTPSQTAVLDKTHVKGFLTNQGGKTSHAAIIARSLEIPAIVGLTSITRKAAANDVVAMDGQQGEVFINPSPAQHKKFASKMLAMQAEHAENLKFRGLKSLTRDGRQVEIAANIGSPLDMAQVLAHDAEGVGLFRSEFLYINAKFWPTEDEQFASYKSVLQAMGQKRVIVRTLDIGGDKTLQYYQFPEEMNPFLGYRAIRLCLDQPGVFKTQLRALLRASVYGNLAIMFPMIATIDEFLQAKAILNACRTELQNQKVPVADQVEVGMMVEVPAAATMAPQFAMHADFFSIGTNDLMQYTMAVDRMSPKVAYLYQPLNPAILNMIAMTIKGAHAHGKWVGMCGEMASDGDAIPLLIGLGLDEFSVTAPAILGTRRLIARIDSHQAQSMAHQALHLATEDEVKKIVKKFKNNIQWRDDR